MKWDKILKLLGIILVTVLLLWRRKTVDPFNGFHLQI